MVDTGQPLSIAFGDWKSDRYQLQHRLGQSAGRQTWAALDLQAEPPELVVVKFLAFGGDVGWEQLKLFEREAQVLRELDHPQIPCYRDYFSIDDRTLWFALVQDYIPGICLRDALAQGRRFSEAQVRRLATEVLEILVYLHGLNPPILHRDIKPSNLIWGEDDAIYLVDLGAVQDRAVAEGATFTVVGTYGYAPIEQYGGRAVPASDLYALGATLIHVLTGISPAELPQKDLQIQWRDRISISPQFADWISRLAHPDFSKRPVGAIAALGALTTSPKPLKADPITPVLPPRNKRFNLTASPSTLEIEERGIFWAYLIVIFGLYLLWYFGLYPHPLLLLGGVCISFWGYLLTRPYRIVIQRRNTHQFQLQAGRRLPKFWLLARPTPRPIYSDIQNVFHARASGARETRKLVWQTSIYDVVLLSRLQWHEANWLVQEIKRWLAEQADE